MARTTEPRVSIRPIRPDEAATLKELRLRALRDVPQAFSTWDDHARFMDALFDAGKVILGGPFADGSGSMVILAVESVEAARAIYQKDPWTQQDVLVAAEVKEWTIFLDGRHKT